MSKAVERRMGRWGWMAALLLAIWSLSCIGSPTAMAYSDEEQLFSEAWRIVDRAYVDDTFNQHNWWKIRQTYLRQLSSDRDSTYDAIQDMLGLLDDPFTRLLRPQQYKSLQTDTSGELTGVGLQLTQDKDTGELVVIAPIEGSPAQQANIRPRDRILSIDGVEVSTLTLDDAAERMRGPVGSRVVLTIRHVAQVNAPHDPVQAPSLARSASGNSASGNSASGNPASEDIALIRDTISLNPVYAELRSPSPDFTVGYIRLSQFNANATEEVRKAIKDFENQGANAYLLDLRNNPGGLLQSGIEIARLWLKDGTIVHTVNRNGIQDRFYANGQALTDAPLAVLVNSGTASASEILSGALQDNKRAVLVGEQTFGKGLIQSLFNLSDGSGLAVTIARYETPDHHDINKKGITPDVEVPMESVSIIQGGTEDDRQYSTAVDLLTTSAQS